MSKSGLHPRRTAVMRARGDISATILRAIRVWDLSQAELMMILAQEMMACSGVMVAEERQKEPANIPMVDFNPPKGGPYDAHAFEIDPRSQHCSWCGAGRLHPIHREVEG